MNLKNFEKGSNMLIRMVQGAMAASVLGAGLAVAGICGAAPANAGCIQIGYEAGPWGPGKTKSCTDKYGNHISPPDGSCDGWYWVHRDQYQVDQNTCY